MLCLAGEGEHKYAGLNLSVDADGAPDMTVSNDVGIINWRAPIGGSND